MAAQTTIDTARTLLADASHIEVFTGAGMSADSGIATYRDAQTGLWENVDPQDMASIDAWHDDPDTMFAWYLCAPTSRSRQSRTRAMSRSPSRRKRR